MYKLVNLVLPWTVFYSMSNCLVFLWVEVRELRSKYVPIDIFGVVVSLEIFLYTAQSNTKNLEIDLVDQYMGS